MISLHLFPLHPSNERAIGLMSISSSAGDRKRIAVTRAKEASATAIPITLSERSLTGMALIRICVGYLWFQQLFWKMPPTFAGLYRYIVRESQHTFLPGYCGLFQPVIAGRLHGICTAGGVRLDS